MPAPRVLSIQSQVISGHVGNSVAAFVLQRLGFEVLAVPTVLLSHHPGHGPPAGRRLETSEIDDFLASLRTKGRLDGARGLLSGYLGREGNADPLLRCWSDMRRENPRALYLCDPVIGDRQTGLYVDEAIAATFRDRLVPAAAIVTPNQFELEWLSGRRISDLGEAMAACEYVRNLGPRLVVCTSRLGTDTPTGQIETLAVAADGAWIVATPRLDKIPHGSGDLLAALLFAHLLQGVSVPAALARAVSATYSVLSESAGAPELRLIETQALLARPPAAFAARRLR